MKLKKKNQKQQKLNQKQAKAKKVDTKSTKNNLTFKLLKLKITASDVNKLRQSTGAGMMDCKKALEESNGDFEKAIEILRKRTKSSCKQS